MYRHDELVFPSADVEKPTQNRSGERRPAKRLSDAGTVQIVFNGTVDEARAKARYIINERSHEGYVRVIQDWKQLGDGRIEFKILRMRL